MRASDDATLPQNGSAVEYDIYRLNYIDDSFVARVFSKRLRVYFNYLRSNALWMTESYDKGQRPQIFLFQSAESFMCNIRQNVVYIYMYWIKIESIFNLNYTFRETRL